MIYSLNFVFFKTNVFVNIYAFELDVADLLYAWKL